MGYMAFLQNLEKKGAISSKDYENLAEFYTTYQKALQDNGKNAAAYEPILTQYLEFIIQESQSPYQFENYHQAIRSPFDFHRFGIEVFKPLIRMEDSEIRHPERLKEIEEHLAHGDNVVLFANHQTEPDPQIISAMLEKEHIKLSEEMIFVAGNRVTTDPVAIPVSKGCNLLCIYSKKHIENPPEEKQRKQLHNQKTMHRMSQLLSEGSKCIYVAPSGGRDRMNHETGKVDIAPFDSASIEMFWLMAQHSSKPTHFYPLSLSTYDILPPPKTVEKDVGERRYAQCAPVFLSFGKEIDMKDFPGNEGLDKKAKREARAQYIFGLVSSEFNL